MPYVTAQVPTEENKLVNETRALQTLNRSTDSPPAPPTTSSYDWS